MLPVRIPQLVNERMKNFKSVIYEQPQHWRIQGGAPPARASPNRINFFRFRICFCQKVYASEVGAPPMGWHPPPMGNPGSATAQCYYTLRVHTSLHLIRAYAIVHRKILMLNSGTTLRIFKVNVKLHRIKTKYQSLRIIAWSTDLTLICHAISQTVLSSGVDLSQ